MFRRKNEQEYLDSIGAMGKPGWVIAGLGNPGSRYEDTRHNVGFVAIDILGKEQGIKVKERKFAGLCGTGMIGGEKVLLLKPQTYMNKSGESIAAALRFYQLDASRLIVLYDDISLEPGRLRIRSKGSAGGHNGIKNIILHLKTQEFLRIKIGVGEKPEGWDLVDYVLGTFPKAERQAVRSAEEDATESIPFLLQGEVQTAMNRYN